MAKESKKDAAIQKENVDEKLVTEAVKFINEKANETLYRGSEEIGAYILEHFFDGDIKKATSRNPHKTVNYKALCTHDDLVVAPERLSVMVRVAGQEKLFAEKKIAAEQLSYSHKAELVKLEDDDSRLQLAKEALKKKLSVRALSERVKEVRGEALAGKDPSLILLEKKVTDPVWLFENPRRSSLFKDETRRKKELKRMRQERRRRLLEQIDEALHKTQEWQELYESLKRDLEEIDRERDEQAEG